MHWITGATSALAIGGLVLACLYQQLVIGRLLKSVTLHEQTLRVLSRKAYGVTDCDGLTVAWAPADTVTGTVYGPTEGN